MEPVPHDPAANETVETESLICTPEHCYYAFDTLYCALTKGVPILPTFPDEK